MASFEALRYCRALARCWHVGERATLPRPPSLHVPLLMTGRSRHGPFFFLGGNAACTSPRSPSRWSHFRTSLLRSAHFRVLHFPFANSTLCTLTRKNVRRDGTSPLPPPLTHSPPHHHTTHPPSPLAHKKKTPKYLLYIFDSLCGFLFAFVFVLFVCLSVSLSLCVCVCVTHTASSGSSCGAPPEHKQAKGGVQCVQVHGCDQR